MEPFASSLKLVDGTLDTDSNNIKISQPGITKRKRTGIMVPCIDDSDNTSYVQNLESVFSSRGVKGTFFVENAWWYSNLSALHSIYNNSTFELGCHSHSHSDLSTTGNTFSITKVGATIDVDRDTDTITVTPGGTVSGFKAKSFGAINTELTGLGCTCGAYSTGLNLECHGESFADSSGAQASPYTPQLLIDTTCDTGFFKTEIADAKTLLDDQFAFVSRSFATPGGATSADVETAVKNSGFWGCRNAYDEPDAERALVSIDLYQLSQYDVSTFITYSSATDAQVATRTRAICENAAKTGSIIFLLAHTAAECTAAQWGIILDTIAEYSSDDIKVMSMGDALYYIKNSGLWSTSDNRTYTRTWTDSTDYTLLEDSPCINAGTEANVSDDYDGNVRPQGYSSDIGAYETDGGINFA
jgi:peptidoglycan/xylan/chitin deacetylase (PgdA/CDA1 family)